MATSLHRELLYSDKYELEDFGLPEDVQDKLYELYVTTKDSAVENYYSVVDVFNEIFYALTCIYNDPSAAEHVGEYIQREIRLFPNKVLPNDPVSNYPVHDDTYENQQFLAKRYVYSFVWLILEINTYKPKNVKFFLVALDKQIRDRNLYFDNFYQFSKKYNWKLTMDFRPNPDIFYSQAAQEWYEETKDFDKEIVSNIVSRFDSLPDKARVVDIIRKAIKETADPNHPSSTLSRKTLKSKADDAFLDKLLQTSKEEQTQRIEEERVVEQSKDERIAELEAQIKDLKSEKRDAESDRDHWKREYEHLVRRINEQNRQLQLKKIPAEFTYLPGSEIIQQLINKDLIRVLHKQDGSGQIYQWLGPKNLFGYFVEKVSFELDLRKSGKSGNIIWEPFMKAFYKAEELRHEAASAISKFKKKGALLPEGAEKIDEAIEYANAMAVQHKD